MTKEEAIARIKNHMIIHKMNEPRAIYISEALDMAIKAIEQEHCKDAISRQAVLDVVKKNTFRLTFAEEQDCEGHVLWSAKAVPSDAIEGALLELPPVTPQQKTGHWITVSEKLPKWGEEVLTINNDGDYEINHIMDDERNEWFYDNGIVAWMPLPEPYKAEKEDEE